MQFSPHPYQAYCIDRLLSDPALGLLLDMGLGKTVITLTAINELQYNRFQVGRVLIVAPKKVAEATWQKEASKWDHLRHLRFASVLGSAAKRIQALHSPADIWVVNRENVPWLVEYYRNAWPFDMVVLDESSSFKNTGLGSNSHHSGSAGIFDRIYSDQRCSLPEAKPVCMGIQYG